MAPGSKSGLGDIARVREYAREYAKVRARVREYASTRARMFDGPNFGELKFSSAQAGNVALGRLPGGLTSGIKVNGIIDLLVYFLAEISGFRQISNKSK